MKQISICIPTYNRSQHLSNCLHSIIHSQNYIKQNVEICVSDNSSSDDTESVVKNAQKETEIKYKKNKKNLGIPRNFLNVVDMAEGEFVWLFGDDDLLMPDGLEKLNKLIKVNQDVDFFYVNSYHLTTEYVFKHKQPFNSVDLPKNMEKFSSYENTGTLPFMDLIRPEVSFDFLGGMFLSVFRRKNWNNNNHILDKKALKDNRTFSHFDNTFPHVKIFSKAFSNSKAYFNKDPLNICLYGAREWEPMYNFIKSVRLVESVEEYRKNGLPLFQYIYCKNFALRSFIPNIAYMYMNKKESGYKYINLFSLIFKNHIYPNFYLSFFYFFLKRINKKLSFKHRTQIK